MDVRVGVGRDDGRLCVEAGDHAQVEAHSDVLAPFARVLGIRRRRAVVGREKACDDEGLAQGSDVVADLLAERRRNHGRIENLRTAEGVHARVPSA